MSIYVSYSYLSSVFVMVKFGDYFSCIYQFKGINTVFKSKSLTLCFQWINIKELFIYQVHNMYLLGTKGRLDYCLFIELKLYSSFICIADN
jgi:hypothetical protein